MRIGHGYDVHRLVSGRDLILGGVKIPYDQGLDGHSDADVLLHAVMDALLGAAGLGDIGRHFPDTDPGYKDISSMLLLRQVGEKIRAAGFAVGNIDVTMIAQKPKLKGFIPQMQENIASALGMEAGRVNVKATTEERLGFTGTGEGMACHAVCLLEESAPPSGHRLVREVLFYGETEKTRGRGTGDPRDLPVRYLCPAGGRGSAGRRDPLHHDKNASGTGGPGLRL